MANVFDLTVSTPQEIVITNKAKTEEVFDAGSLQRSDFYRVPVTTVSTSEDGKQTVETTYEVKKRSELSDDEMITAVKVAFKNTDRRIQMYKVNNYVDLKQGDSVKITAEFSEEVAYFISLASEDLEVVAYPLVDTKEEDTTPSTSTDETGGETTPPTTEDDTKTETPETGETV